MRDVPGGPASIPDGAIPDKVAALWTIVDLMQIARHGGPELDARLDEALADGIGAEAPTTVMPAAAPAPGWHPTLPMRGGRWSTDLTDAILLLPPDYNFSLGHRDSVFWAWIQPNDCWEPAEYRCVTTIPTAADWWLPAPRPWR